MVASFELIDATAAAAMPDVLGVWATAAPAAAGPILGAAAVAAPDVPVWRVNLPADPRQAAARLADAAALLRQAERSRDVAARRIEDVVAARSGVLGAGELAMAQPEQDLLAMLSQPPGTADAALLGASGDDIGAWWDQAGEQIQAYMQRTLQAAAYYAWVETLEEDRLLARSLISWAGAASTAYRRGLTRAAAAEHQRALALALASRAELVRTFALVVRGAVLLATAAASPVSAVMALPAAWKFVNDVVVELRDAP